MRFRQGIKRLLKVTQLNNGRAVLIQLCLTKNSLPWDYIFLDKFNSANYIKILCYGDESDNECKIALKDSRNINELSKLI